MRLSSLLLGGVIGASTVWILNNRNHPLVNMMKLMKQNSKSSSKSEAGKQASQQQAYSEQTRAENASLIRSIIENDTKLQKEFNSITSQAATQVNGAVASEQAQQH